MTRIDLDELGVTGVGDIYGHEGFPQAFMFYWPKQRVTVVGTLNQAVSERVDFTWLVLGVVRLLD